MFIFKINHNLYFSFIYYFLFTSFFLPSVYDHVMQKQSNVGINDHVIRNISTKVHDEVAKK